MEQEYHEMCSFIAVDSYIHTVGLRGWLQRERLRQGGHPSFVLPKGNTAPSRISMWLVMIILRYIFGQGVLSSEDV